MLDPLQFYCRVLCNGMKTRFRMVMIAHPGPGIGFHKRFMWRIIIPPTAEQSLSEDLDHGAFVMDITRAAESDHLAQELRSKLETSNPPWGWEWSEGQLQFQGHLYIPNQEILRLQVIRNHHNHPVAGHFREARTSKLIHHSFHWPGL